MKVGSSDGWLFAFVGVVAVTVGLWAGSIVVPVY
jgi:hypothetical protein